MRYYQRYRTILEQASRDAAEKKFPGFAMTISSHHDITGIQGICAGKKHSLHCRF
tara:strand:- start:143 stop:307 length:165 start_codon:yes stop_codon:yes gene_type:complete